MIGLGEREVAAPTRALPRWLLAILCCAAFVIGLPYAPWVVLAVWLGLAGRRLHRPLCRLFGGRRSLAATVTLASLLLVIAPIAALVASLAIDAVGLVQEAIASDQASTLFRSLVSGGASGGGGHDSSTLHGLGKLVMSQGHQAWTILTQVAGVAAHVTIGLVILILGIYGVLVDGPGWYAWIERHAPCTPSHLRRFADAFVETGRGMAFGVVGAGVLQSIIATIAYLVIGVPSALALGVMTLMFSVVPAIGTAMVWIPVAIGLAVTGQTAGAIGLGVVGVAIIGTVDNISRPFLARMGKLDLPSYVVLVAMFGGIALIGGWGLVLGPLVVRLAKEAIAIRTESRIIEQ